MSDETAKEHDPDAAARLIAEAHRTPRPLPADELDRWLTTIPYMGRPELRRGKRGPPSKKSQYTDAVAWRRRVLRHHKAMAGRAPVSAQNRRTIAEALASIPAATPARHVVRAVANWLDHRGGPMYARSTIARYVRALTRRKPPF